MPTKLATKARLQDRGISVRDRPYNAAADGVTDEIGVGAFQGVHDDLPSDGGDIVVPSGIYLLDGTGGSIASPKILCTVSKPNVRFIISPGAKFLMKNWSKTDSDANNDAGAGTNVFTGILFGDGVVGGGVWGGYVVGDSDGTALTNLRSRAKFIAIDGADDIVIERLRGTLIVGNLVNARGSGGGLSAARRIIVANCHADSCAENGFNYMGGVEDSVFSNNISRLNKYHGFESGAQRLACTGNVMTDNGKDGITHVGRYGLFTGNVCRNNTLVGFNFQWSSSSGSDGSYNSLVGNILTNNGQAGVTGDGSTTHNTIKQNTVIDNTNEGIKLNIGCSYYDIDGNTVGDTGGGVQTTGIDVITGTHISIKNNRTYGHSVQGLTVNTNSDSVRVMNNDFGDTAVIASSTTNRFVRNNRGYVTEISGTATIASGTTSVAVAHGLSTGSSTTAAAFQLTLTNNPTAVTRYWISGITSTQFTINVNADPGATTATFVWSANVQT